MRSFRQLVIIPALLGMLAFVAFFATGCKNKCGSTTCDNGGSCESNVCVCPTGYSGASCQNSWASAAVGTYTCTNANCTPAISAAASWQSIITADATNGGYTIDISNFDGNNTTVVGVVDSSIHGVSQVTIANCAGVNATGAYDSSANPRLNLRFTVYTGGTASYSCNMVMTKIL